MRRGVCRVARLGVALGSLVLGSLGARAETLQEALTLTYQTNPDLAAERARLREVDEDVSQANAKWRPSLALEGEIERVSESVKKKSGKFDYRTQSWSADLVATQPLFTGGRNSAEKRGALARVEGARARLRVREQRVLLDAVRAFVDVARNEAVLDLVRQDLLLLQDLLKDVRERQEKTQATESDVDQTVAALEAARALCIANLAELRDSWRAYEQIVGSVPALAAAPEGDRRINACLDAKSERLRSAIVMPEELPAAPASLDEVEAAVQGSVPELDAARAEEEETRYAVSAAYAELLPTAEITARLGTSGEEFDPTSITREASIGAEFVIPIFNNGSEWSEIRAARERNNRARLSITSSQRQITRDAVRAWYDLVSIRAIRAVNKMQAASVQRAFEGLRKEMADPKLHRSMTDLLGLRQAALGTRSLLIASDRDEAVALYRLLASMGKLNAAFLQLPVQVYDAEANTKTQAKRVIGDSIQGE
ncbi:MAG: TolC family protein [Alphaproteobacteria bacterium]|nr:TolC family protein [Alphaproteobacteria bacterium]